MKYIIAAIWTVPLVIYCDGKGPEEAMSMFAVWFGCAVGTVITCEILGVEVE